MNDGLYVDGLEGWTRWRRQEADQRRLRAYLRYARMSVAMALAKCNHHAAPRGQNMARAGEEGHEKKHNALPQGAAAGTQTGDDAEYTAQFVIPQEHFSQCIMEQSVDTPFPQAMERTVESEYLEPGLAAAAPAAVCAATAAAAVKEDTYALPAPETEYASSSSAPSRVIANGAPAPADTKTSPVPLTEYASSLPWPMQDLLQ